MVARAKVAAVTEPASSSRAPAGLAARLAPMIVAIAPGARASVRAVRRGVGWGARFLWRQRAVFVGLGTRAAWWVALVMWWACAVALAGTERVDVQASLRSFAIGAVLCAVVVAIAGASRQMRHLQWAGGVLGSLHGICGVILWSILGA